MADPFIGEIRMLGFNFAPRNWALCDGALLPILQNQQLYSLLGIQFGGDGRTSFALPDLRGRVPVHTNDELRQGIQYGFENVTLNNGEMPAHTHAFSASNQPATASNVSQDGTTVFALATDNFYTSASNIVALAPATGSPTGGGESHNNRQPSLAVNFSIALTGLYPSRN